MPTVTLVPTSLTDTNSNVAAGGFVDIDETIASADGTTLDSVTNNWTGSGTGSAFTFGMSNLPAEAVTINTVKFRVRARVTSGGSVDDTVRYICNVSGTNAPTTKATFTDVNAGAGFKNKGASSGVTTNASVAEVNAWTVRVYQDEFKSKLTEDGLNLEIDCIEIIVDYSLTSPVSPSDPSVGGTYTVLPTTNTTIYGICIAQARDFVILGGLDADRYSIRWCAIGDPTDWPDAATDDARSKQAGVQVFPTRFGWVTGIAGDDFSMIVFQEGAVHRSTYVGGDVVWTFDAIDESRGCVRHGRLLKIDDLIFFQSKFGYHVIKDGKITDIGYGVVDDTFN